jgi:hypothetical protein
LNATACASVSTASSVTTQAIAVAARCCHLEPSRSSATTIAPSSSTHASFTHGEGNHRAVLTDATASVQGTSSTASACTTKFGTRVRLCTPKRSSPPLAKARSVSKIASGAPRFLARAPPHHAPAAGQAR